MTTTEPCNRQSDTPPFTAAQVLAALEPHIDSWSWFDHETVTIDGVEYAVKEVERTGGMDEGSRASVTLQIGSQFFRKSGYYASHYGYDWDGDFTEVHPVTKTVTVYE